MRHFLRARLLPAALLLCAARSGAAPADGGRILALTREQCAFGPRVTGSPAHAAARAWLVKRVEELGLKVWEQAFDAKLALNEASAKGVNIWGLPFDPASPPPEGPLLVLSAHWDTRPKADRDPPGEEGVLAGANDAASGVAQALEIARMLKGTPAGKGLVLAFWDAEDGGIESRPETYCLGSRHAAANPPPWWGRVRLGLNLDMTGHAGLRLSREAFSRKAAPRALERLWRIGLDLAPGIFNPKGSAGAIVDDHYPFIEAGKPYIDLIGLPYEHWHRSTDTPERLDPAVLAAVADVAAEFLRRELSEKGAP